MYNSSLPPFWGLKNFFGCIIFSKTFDLDFYITVNDNLLGKSLWKLKCTGNLATVSATCIVLVLKQDSDPGKVTLSDYESDLGFVLWDIGEQPVNNLSNLWLETKGQLVVPRVIYLQVQARAIHFIPTYNTSCFIYNEYRSN